MSAAGRFSNSGLCSLFFIALTGCLLVACTPLSDDRSLTWSGPVMGTDFRITVVVPLQADTDSLVQQIENLLQALEQSMSTYIPDSEISRFNVAAAGEPFEISTGMAEVLTEALRISQLSDGYFDVTVAPLVNAWGFGPDGRISSQPDEQQLTALRNSIGYQKLLLKDRFLSKSDDRVTIDLSAIAKGYAVDQVALLLHKRDIHDFLVDIGGELRASGHNVDGNRWRVGIERPQVLGGVDRVVALQNMAIATSGDYRNYLLLDGEKFSHTIDPNTLRPAIHRLALVSVITERAITADAMATAMMAMGEGLAQEFAAQNQLAAYFVIRDRTEEKYKAIATPQFQPYLRE